MTTKPSKFTVFNDFVDFAAPHCRPAEYRVWIYLWRRANRDCHVRFRVSDVSNATGLTWKSAKSAVTSLQQIGLLALKLGNNWQHHKCRLAVHDSWRTEGHPRKRQVKP